MSDRKRGRLPSALDAMEEIEGKTAGRKVVVFLDYDGTLTPIVSRPADALLSEAMRETLLKLKERCPVAIISGRDLADVRDLVGIGDIFYAGSHGFDIAGPRAMDARFRNGEEFLPALDQAEKKLREFLDVEGVLVERKKFSISVHYRNLKRGEDAGAVEVAVDRVVAGLSGLRKSRGKKVFEIQPQIDWHKGRALGWVLSALHLDRPEVLPFYIGDDVTDEDAFRAVKGRGLGIAVMDEDRPTEASYVLRAPEQVRIFLEQLAEGMGRRRKAHGARRTAKRR